MVFIDVCDSDEKFNSRRHVICWQEDDGVTFIYWALFDGHAGAGASLMAANLLHHHVAKQLQGIVELLRSDAGNVPVCLDDDGLRTRRPSGQASMVVRGVGSPPSTSPGTPSKTSMEKEVSQDALVIGAIENAFREMVRHAFREMMSFDFTLNTFMIFFCSIIVVKIRCRNIIARII